MFDILFNTFSYLLIIALGYFLKRNKLVPANASDTIMVLVLNLTLPCLLINSSVGSVLSASMIVYLIIGLLVNVVALIISFLANHKKETPDKTGVCMLSSSGIDVGDFVLPFVASFFPGEGVITLCIFNIGNTIMNSGVNYAVASKIAATDSNFGIKDILKKLFSSVAFDAYLLILFMSITKLPWPDKFLHITGIIANANIFLVMLMFGMKLEFSIEPSERRTMFRVLTTRFGWACLFTIITILLPLPTLGKIILIAAFFGPPSSTSTIFSRSLGYKGSLASQINVICIFSAMAIITAVMIIGNLL